MSEVFKDDDAAAATSAATYLVGPILVVGTGLLGASVGLGLTRAGLEVYLQDPSPSAQQIAQDVGAGRILPVGEKLSPELVVCAAPPDVTARVVSQALRDYPHAVVVDIASVKSSILNQLLADPQLTSEQLSRYVGTHPMSGREKSGPAAARGELFVANPWVITAHDGASERAIRTARSLVADLGGVPTAMDPLSHDHAVALVSHMPQITASLLASRLLNAESSQLALAGNGLRDTTRIAASDPRLWIQILAHNAPQIVGHLEGMQEDIDRLISTLKDPSADGALLDLAELFGEGNAGHARIPGKHGAPPQSFAVVTVLVDDTPGQIARLLKDVGDANINLEDLRMDHANGRPVGMVEISVLPGKEAELEQVLQNLKWRVVK
ncbi:prephenate dehydrogenase [Neomicrococcus aestuarii]|uniref:Prephenate dehydrogenase n=1 Tax=Neomicrococcus aestuarii TaxID=556325 RepID=A0A1L2ZM14_9MICC|nr:prephenate dehydrogenase [Neomicrococcus aestuarii]APF40247.1 prephenate dehydrogenase [Neomicrococcus aestuarii]